MYSPPTSAEGIRDPLATNSFNIARTKDDESINPTQLQPWPFPLTGGAGQGARGMFSSSSVPLGLREPTVQQYNATFEQHLGLDTSVRFSSLGITAHGL